MNNYQQRMDHGNEAHYNRQQGGGGLDNIYDPHYDNLRNAYDDRGHNRIIERRPWNEERDRNWNIKGDRGDRNMFERMGDAIRDKWNDWTGNDDRSRAMDRQGDVRAGRSWDRDWDRIRSEEGRMYNRDDYRTSGQRGGYIADREMGSDIHNRSGYDYGTGNYGAQGMRTTAYDQDFTYTNRGHNAGSANVKGGYYYDRNNEPDFNRDRSMRYHDEEHRHWRDNSSDSNRRDDMYARSDRYTSRDNRYRGSNDRVYRNDDYTAHGERAYFGNDAYGAGVMGGYHDTFPEDFRYREWARGTR